MALATTRTLRFGAVLLVVFILFGGLLLVANANPRLPVQILAVRVTNLRDTTFTVSWQTPDAVTGTVRYGTAPNNLSFSVRDDRDPPAPAPAGQYDTHYGTITGLTPNTTYYFDVLSESAVDTNMGNHYTATTGATLGPTQPDLIYGQVLQTNGTSFATGAIVYITLQDSDTQPSPGSALPLSALVDEFGYWFTNLSDARQGSGNAYFTYSPSNDRLALQAKLACRGNANATVMTGNDSPAPTITLNMAPNPCPPLAVTLSDFSAQWNTDNVAVQWETATERDILGFNLYRAISPDATRTQVNDLLIPSEAPGQGGGARYRFTDTSVVSGTPYFYWLEAVDMQGGTTLFGPVSTGDQPTAIAFSDLTIHTTPWWHGVAGIAIITTCVGFVFLRQRYLNHESTSNR